MTILYRKMVGLVWGGLAAWALIVCFDIGSSTLRSWLADISGKPHISSSGFYGLANTLPFYLFFGLPLSIVLVSSFGLPIWAVWETKGRGRRSDLALAGALAGLFLSVVINLAFPIFSHTMWSNNGGAFDSWNGGFQTYSDGHVTYFGLLFHFLDVAGIVLAGALAGWIVAVFDGTRSDYQSHVS